MNSIGGVSGIGAPLPLNRIGDDGSFAMGTEKVIDGALEAWTDNTPNEWAESGESAGVRDITKETTEIHGGAAAAKLQATDNDGTMFRIFSTANIALTVNKYYELQRWIYYPTRTVGELSTHIYNSTDGPMSLIDINSTNAAYTLHSGVFAPTVSLNLVYLEQKSETTTGIAYFDDISVRDVDLIARRYGGELIGAIGMQQIALWDKWSN